MASDLSLGEAAGAVLAAASELLRRSKPGAVEWAYAQRAVAGLDRLLDEIRQLGETLDRRAIVPGAAPPDPEPPAARPARPRPTRPAPPEAPDPAQ